MLRSFPTRALALVVLVGACAETTGVDRSQTAVDRWDLQPRFNYYEDGPQQPPPEAPAGYNWYTTISVQADAGFHTGPADEGSPVTAWGVALVSYTGTNATAHAYLDILRNRQVVDKADAPAEDSHAFPAARTLVATARRPVMDRCDLTAAVQAVGTVWNQLFVNFSWTIFGKKTGSGQASASQPRCYPQPGDGGGGGGGQEPVYVSETAGGHYSGGAPQREYCEKTHYWVSNDGGATYRYWYTEDHGCYDII
jgi:hypothetical protein